MMMPDVVALAQEAREREAILAWKADVEQDDVRQAPLDRIAHRGAAVRLRDLVAVRAEVLREHLAHGGVVLDDQNAAIDCHGPRTSLVGNLPKSIAPSSAPSKPARLAAENRCRRDAQRRRRYMPIQTVSTSSSAGYATPAKYAPCDAVVPPDRNTQGERHACHAHEPPCSLVASNAGALRQAHRGVQAHPLGHRPRRHPRARIRLHEEVPARRPVARRARSPFLAPASAGC